MKKKRKMRRINNYSTQVKTKEDLDKNIIKVSKPKTIIKKKKTAVIDSVYFIYNKYTGLIKIGKTIDLNGRLNYLSNANGINLELVYFMENRNNLENKLHRAFKNYRAKGEWFEFKGLLTVFINYLKEKKANYLKDDDLFFAYMLQYIYKPTDEINNNFVDLKAMHEKDKISFMDEYRKMLRKKYPYSSLPSYHNSFSNIIKLLYFGFLRVNIPTGGESFEDRYKRYENRYSLSIFSLDYFDGRFWL